MFSLFSKPRIPVEKQLEALGAAGLRLAPGIEVDDLFQFDDRDVMEKEPYKALITALGSCTEDGDDTPFCSRLWMCDFECIEDHMAYVDIIIRLQILSDGRPELSKMKDYVDIEEGKAWLDFDVNGETVHWDAKVEEDWLDPQVLVNYDALLLKHTDLRIYSNQTDFGQQGLIGCFTKDQFKAFEKLSKVRMKAIAELV